MTKLKAMVRPSSSKERKVNYDELERDLEVNNTMDLPAYCGGAWFVRVPIGNAKQG